MTYTKEEARIEIQKLVEDFRAHEATLESAAEAQIENNFIRPLFNFLNWNTENRGLSLAHYEFKVQATNKKGLRPDYILNLDGRDVLVMDAKQVKYSMKDPRWLYQVYSYAYSTQNSKPSEKIDFAILTDFQELIVLDCTLFAAKPEAVNNFRVLDWTYNDYVEKFDELWELLERNKVLNDSRVVARRALSPTKQSPTDEEIASGKVVSIRGAKSTRHYSTTEVDEEIASGSGLDTTSKSARSTRPPAPATTARGLWSRYLSPQKVKANRIPPDKAFLAEMDDEKSGWRVLLAKDMKKRNPSADGELITAAVQLLIDRLIFIKALSDREVDRDYLSEIKDRVTEAGIGEDDASWFKSSKSIFDELNNFYNGSIFAPRPELEKVSVSNKVVQAVITDLQPENSPYNFAVLPVEILGTIYERFLGRVVHTTDKRVTIEEKPEVRKAGGVYYTPQYIVDYIVANTLGKTLTPSPSPTGRGGLTPADVAKLKILDPACGSGSFLLGAYSALIEWHKDYFARAGKEKRDRESFYKDESGQIRLTAKLKREILKNNLFGVDIDPQAVEVTRFSLSLKALEDLREGELTEERTLFHQTVLPDLSQNIKNGNSLIGNDYFGLITPTAEELKEVKPFNWKSEFKEIMENGGFDCVIGNPPYLKIEHISEADREYFSKRYQTFIKRYDIYGLFIENSIEILKQAGLFGMIVPSTMLNNISFRNLRKLLLDNVFIHTIVNLGGKVFEAVNNDTLILVYEKGAIPKSTTKIFDVLKYGEKLESAILTGEKDLPNSSVAPDYVFELRVSDEIDIVLKKMQNNNVRLGDLFACFQGFVTGGNEAYIVDIPTAKHKNLETTLCKSAVFGDEVARYKEPSNKTLVIYLTREMKLSQYPKIKEHIEPFKAKLETKREVKLGRQPWYAMHWPRVQENFERTPKLLVQAIRNLSLKRRVIATIDNKGLYADHTLNVLYPIQDKYDIRFALGLLNSNLINFLFLKKYVDINIKGVYLTEISIPALDFTNPAEKSQHEKMVALVTQMLELHKSKAGAKTQADSDVYERQIRAVDEQIDELVYQLYGLSPDEIKIVEGKG